MSVFEIIPVEQEGMSVVTGIVLFFSGVGSVAVLRWVIDKFNTHNIRLNEHDVIFDEVRKELVESKIQATEMAGDIKQTQMIVGRIDQSLSDIARTNIKVLEHYLKKDK